MNVSDRGKEEDEDDSDSETELGSRTETGYHTGLPLISEETVLR